MELEKQYPKEWVVIQNKIIECFKGMSLDEKRLFLMATPLARIAKLSVGDPIIITVEEYANECGIDKKTAYNAVENATKRLFRREFSFVTASKDKVLMRWLYKAVYNEGSTSLYFPDDILALLRTFDKLNPYTKYKKEVVLKLKRDYSLDFYHLGKKHQVLKQFSISLEDLSKNLDLSESYTRIDNIKKRVIDPSLEEINEKTDITMIYANIKQGRRVVGFKFFITAKEPNNSLDNLENNQSLINANNCNSEKITNKPKKAPSWQHKGLTDAQINKIAKHRDEFVDANKDKFMSANFRGGYSELFDSWRSLLKDPTTVLQFKMIQELLERSIA